MTGGKKEGSVVKGRGEERDEGKGCSLFILYVQKIWPAGAP